MNNTKTNESVTDKAARIRTRLKEELGLTSRDVSVKADSFSMGSAIDLCIKDTPRSNAVALQKVEDIAQSVERIRRCEVSGEILSGGNLYVSVSRSRESADAIAQKHLAAVEAAIAKLGDGSGTIEQVTDRYGVSSRDGLYLSWGADEPGERFNSALGVARWVAEKELNDL